MLHLWCKGAALLLALLFESLYSGFSDDHCYDILSVYLCCTIGIAMRYLWYQDALLLWYRFFNLFTGNIKVDLVTKCSKIHP